VQLALVCVLFDVIFYFQTQYTATWGLNVFIFMKQITQLRQLDSPSPSKHGYFVTKALAGVKGVFDYFEMDPKLFPPADQRLTAIYSRDKEYL